MRDKPHYMPKNVRIKYGKPRNRFYVTILLIVGLSVGGYFCFVPAISGRIDVSSTLPASIPSAQALENPSDSPEQPHAAASMAAGRASGYTEISDYTGHGDTLVSILASSVHDDALVSRIATRLASVIRKSLNDKGFDVNSVVAPGKFYRITLDGEERFLKATLELDAAYVFHAVAKGDSLRVWQENVVLDFREEALTFTLKNTLIESVLSAGETMELALRLTQVFRYDIDFYSDPMNGDECRVLFERRYADDRPSGYGRILCAVYKGKKTGLKYAVLFNNNYYNNKAQELKKPFLKAPLNTLRVTSRFGRRLHPILKVWRQHKGVDYGAPIGTKVLSVAKGTVTYAGWAKGYGKYVCISHSGGYESRYGHLHKIFVKKGAQVEQGQSIGQVGRTGLATGPHLDFQFLKDGKHRNPEKIRSFKVKNVRTVPNPLKRRFYSLRDRRLQVLEQAAHSPGKRGRRMASHF